MKPEIKEQLIAALESGKYTHTTGQLKRINDDGVECHCALGVLADIVDGGAWVMHTEEDEGETYTYFTYGDNDSTSVPPDSFLERIGMSYYDATDIYTANDQAKDYNSVIDMLKSGEAE